LRGPSAVTCTEPFQNLASPLVRPCATPSPGHPQRHLAEPTNTTEPPGDRRCLPADSRTRRWRVTPWFWSLANLMARCSAAEQAHLRQLTEDSRVALKSVLNQSITYSRKDSMTHVSGRCLRLRQRRAHDDLSDDNLVAPTSAVDRAG